MTDPVGKPLSGDEEALDRGTIRVPADADVTIKDLTIIKEEGADVTVNKDGTVDIRIPRS